MAGSDTWRRTQREQQNNQAETADPNTLVQIAITYRDRLVTIYRNGQRYAPYIAAFESVDTTRLTDFYQRYYPLFQEAYVELGYPSGYFNDRLIEVIDHLLTAPEPKGPLKLTQPKVLYEFASMDPENHVANTMLLEESLPDIGL